MYLSNLNEKEKVIFLEIANNVAKANGNIDATEQTFLDHYIDQLQLDKNEIEFKNLTIEEAVKKIDSEKSKRAIFIECVALAFADEIYHEEQKEVIYKLKEAFGFSFHFYHSVKNWVIRVNELYKKGMELIESDID
ncbi:TerB family tellurite resistance protein [Natranaerofaba carboxydovora]|uniref:tellurite resistance TerB family protein n=1 Tax=Natranaerofaba carboxydovora TaxID=2742683 RepID=UPI001F139E8E|nr:TerB family tellurite resistance protein [Natranaerofaba carboxydovora]UMZ74145.1 hypothetical protein ACONDI_01725 [Natranaerofaba carboxydovora]